VRKLTPSDGWQRTAAAVARQVLEDEQEDGNAAEDEAVVLEEDRSDQSVTRRQAARSAGPVKWVVPACAAWEVLAADRGGWRSGLKREPQRLKVNESEVGAS
jgi:hypothetical protein